MVRLLLERGADLSMTGSDGKTAEDVAREEGFVDVLWELAKVRQTTTQNKAGLFLPRDRRITVMVHPDQSTWVVQRDAGYSA